MAVEQKRVSDMPLVPDGQLGSFDVFGWNKTTNQSGRAPMSKLKGDRGAQGIQGERGVQGEKGDRGIQGVKGDSGKSAYELWLQQPGNAGKPYSEYEAYNREPATAAKNEWNVLKPEITNKITEAGEAAEAANTAASNANTAASEANTAKEAANTAATNADNKAALAQTATTNANIATTNANNATSEAKTATTNAQNAADRSNALSDHRDEIRDGYWWRWNETTKEWYNTDELAQGKAVKVLDNGNYAHWNEVTQQYEDSGVEASASIDVENIEVSFQEANLRENINTGEKFPILFGKIRKWFSSLKSLAFKDKVDWNADIDNKPLSMPASDVQAWAKAATKPTYDYSEINNKPTIPVQVNSDWNAVGGIAEIKNKPTSMPANDVYAWAKAATKPAYTASEVGASPLNHSHNYQDKEDGKGLSTNDFTNDYKSFVEFLLTSQSLASTANIPIAANTEVSISANMSLSIANPENLKPGYVMTIRINNTATAARTVTLPSSTTWVNDFGTTLSIAAYSRAEVSVWCYKTGYYAIRVGEV